MSERVLLVFTVPVSDADRVRQALGDAGAGRIGDYSHASLSFQVTGRFTPVSGSNPAVGSLGELEEVSEERVELICNKDQVKEVINLLKQVHPYEEPVYYVQSLLTVE